MLLLPRAVRILLAAQPVDLRNSIDGLVALVRSGWKENVYAGHLFVFVSRRRDRVKVLTWDSGGFVVFYKRLLCGEAHNRRYAERDVMLKDVRTGHRSRRRFEGSRPGGEGEASA